MMFRRGVKGDSCFGCRYCLKGGASCVLGTEGRVEAGMRGLSTPLSCDKRSPLPRGMPTPDDPDAWRDFLTDASICRGVPGRYIPFALDMEEEGALGPVPASEYGEWLSDQGVSVDDSGLAVGPKRFIKGWS